MTLNARGGVQAPADLDLLLGHARDRPTHLGDLLELRQLSVGRRRESVVVGDDDLRLEGLPEDDGRLALVADQLFLHLGLDARGLDAGKPEREQVEPRRLLRRIAKLRLCDFAEMR